MHTPDKHYLIADDDLDDLELLREALLYVAPNAYVAAVSSGVQVFDYLSRCPKGNLPDLIVLDYNMPGMNGADIIEALTAEARFQHIPVVVWSTSGSAHYQEACEKKGARAYFQKPSNFEQITNLAERMLSYSYVKEECSY